MLWLLDFAVVAGWLPAETECVSEHPWPAITDPAADHVRGLGRGDHTRLERIAAARAAVTASAPGGGPNFPPWDAA